jgi:hypothetical protein
MVGDGVREPQVLNLLWKLQREREVLHLKPFADAERRQSAIDQNELQIVRCLAVLALVRTATPDEQ